MKRLLFFTGALFFIFVNGWHNNVYSQYNSIPLRFAYHADMLDNMGDDLNAEVLQFLINADYNEDDRISRGELQYFQNTLMRRFNYQANETALHPNDFWAQGGGDCEDFAIMTCAMLNYHGVVAYVASYGRVTTNKHALCITQIKKPVPYNMIYYTLDYYGFRPGTYIPVDYEEIGGLKAIDRRWKIDYLSVPEDIYGSYR